MSHDLIIESVEENDRHAYGGGVGVMWHPWQVVTLPPHYISSILDLKNSEGAMDWWRWGSMQRGVAMDYCKCCRLPHCMRVCPGCTHNMQKFQVRSYLAISRRIAGQFLLPWPTSMQYAHTITPCQRQVLWVCPLFVHVRQWRREEGFDRDRCSPESKFTNWVGIRSTSIQFNCDPICSFAVWNEAVELSGLEGIGLLGNSGRWISTVRGELAAEVWSSSDVLTV